MTFTDGGLARCSRRGGGAGARDAVPALQPFVLGTWGGGRTRRGDPRGQGAQEGSGGGLLHLAALIRVLLCILTCSGRDEHSQTGRAPSKMVLGGDSGEEEPWEMPEGRMRKGEGQEDCEHVLGDSWRRLGAGERLAVRSTAAMRGLGLAGEPQLS